MTEIRRYATWVDHCDDYWEAEDPDGQWVKWEDVQDLVDERDEARREVEHLERVLALLRQGGKE